MLLLLLFSYVVCADDVVDGNDYHDLCLFHCLLYRRFFIVFLAQGGIGIFLIIARGTEDEVVYFTDPDFNTISLHDTLDR